MSDDGWIVVRNWDKFQHYKKRNPTWIKLYTSIGSDDDFTRLSFGAQGLLVRIWCEYARAHGALSVAQMRRISCRCAAQRSFMRHLVSLNDAGFITILASRPLAPEKRREDSAKNAGKPQSPTHNALEPINVDQAMLDLARDWLNEHRG